jgi:hypothetical protein
MVVMSPDGSSSDEWWALDLATGTAGAYIHVDLRGTGVGIGWARATGVSLLGGLVRAREVANASIPHALALALPGNVLGQGYVWPAITADAAGPGFVPEGSLLAIPPGTPQPAGLSPLGTALFQALTRYGAYVVDQTGGGAAALVVEPSADASAVQAAYGDVRVLLPMLRLVTDNGPGSVGGPGNRVAAMAPGV